MKAVRDDGFNFDRIAIRPERNAQHPERYPYVEIVYKPGTKEVIHIITSFPLELSIEQAKQCYQALEMAIRIAEGESIEDVNKLWARGLKGTGLTDGH